MSDLSSFHDVCAELLSQLASAELIVQETMQTAIRHDAASRRIAVAQDDQVTQQFLTARTLSAAARRQAESTMSRLGLTLPAPARYSVKNDLSSQQMLAAIVQLAASEDELWQELRAKAKQLETERRKWWKFW